MNLPKKKYYGIYRFKENEIEYYDIESNVYNEYNHPHGVMFPYYPGLKHYVTKLYYSKDTVLVDLMEFVNRYSGIKL